MPRFVRPYLLHPSLSDRHVALRVRHPQLAVSALHADDATSILGASPTGRSSGGCPLQQASSKGHNWAHVARSKRPNLLLSFACTNDHPNKFPVCAAITGQNWFDTGTIGLAHPAAAFYVCHRFGGVSQTSSNGSTTTARTRTPPQTVQRSGRSWRQRANDSSCHSYKNYSSGTCFATHFGPTYKGSQRATRSCAASNGLVPS